MTRIKLVLAQPRGFVLSERWQVTEALHQSSSADVTRGIRTAARMQNFGSLESINIPADF